MTSSAILSLAAFVSVSCLVLIVYFLLRGKPKRIDVRLADLAARGEDLDAGQDVMATMTRSVLPAIGKPLLPDSSEERTRLQARLLHAGLYSRHALPVFLGIKMLLMFVPVTLGLALGLFDIMPMYESILVGTALGVAGTLGPNFWLDRRKALRANTFRRSLPDTLDVLVICLEAGLSLAAAFRRVSVELRPAHPLLASELIILQREMQLGLSMGEALRHFAERADLEELRTLASVIVQSERLGAGMAQVLRVHADALRFKRLQRAEELAQKASLKMLFPTLLLIFPGVFIVVLGPAVLRILDMFSQLGP
jgi:tight adherence protein C